MYLIYIGIFLYLFNVSLVENISLENSRTEPIKCGRSSAFYTRTFYGSEGYQKFVEWEDLPRPSCLITSPTQEGRILHGTTPPSLYPFPWIVAILHNGFDYSSHLCAGAILTDYFVLTSAKCVKDYTRGEIFIRVGEYDQDSEDRNEKEYDIDKIFLHPDFNKEVKFNNDIALLKIKPKKGNGFQFWQNVLPVCLPRTHLELPDGMTGKVAGWGKTTDSDYSRFLQIIEVPLVQYPQCLKWYRGKITPGMVCAGGNNVKQNFCYKDIGAPLVMTFDGRATVFGIASWSPSCENGGEMKPGVYTRVERYMSWIRETMENACN